MNALDGEIHDGRHRLDFIGITNYLLNRGGSYSAHYLVNALAVMKHLKGRYARTVVRLDRQGRKYGKTSLQEKWLWADESISDEALGALVRRGLSQAEP